MGRLRKVWIASGAIGVAGVLACVALLSGFVSLAAATHPAAVSGPAGGSDPAITIPLNGTPIVLPNGSAIGALNNTTGHPWGEVYDAKNFCLYVTEDPSTNPGQGYLTFLGPTSTPKSIVIPGGMNPTGIALAPAYLGEPAAWHLAFPGGILAVADSQSNAVSFFGVPLNTAIGTVGCQPLFLETVGFVPDWTVPGQLLQNPYDVVFDTHTGMFYVSWPTSNVVSAFDGPAVGCEFSDNLSTPVGLSVDLKGSLNVANFQANGWVTQLATTPIHDAAPGACTHNVPTSVSAKTYDRAEWTVYAPLLYSNTTTNIGRNIVAVSDSNFNIGGNIVGTPPCVVGTPAVTALGELNDAGLPCVSSAASLAPPLPVPGLYGLAYNAKTHHVIATVNALGMVEAFGFGVAYPPIPVAPPMPTESIEVIWFAPSTAAALAYYQGTPAMGSMVVTNWGAGTLFMATGI
jgi:hypothetical protein